MGYFVFLSGVLSIAAAADAEPTSTPTSTPTLTPAAEFELELDQWSSHFNGDLCDLGVGITLIADKDKCPGIATLPFPKCAWDHQPAGRTEAKFRSFLTDYCDKLGWNSFINIVDGANKPGSPTMQPTSSAAPSLKSGWGATLAGVLTWSVTLAAVRASMLNL